ncbi:MAG TPA: hypothetical protein VGO36_08465 [Solirubrobacterales bacterium]|nr:hypothetical protein [Solirubrobacterales bacterium]
MDGIGVVRDADTMPSQLLPESYRARAGSLRRLRQGGDAFLQLLGPADQGVPEPLPTFPVESREGLAATGVEDGEALAPLACLPQPAPDRVERADAGDRRAEAGGKAARGGDADPQPGEGAGAEADRDQLDPFPAAGLPGAQLDLLEQSRGVLGAALGSDPQQRLVQDLAVAPGAGGGVGGRGVEADDDQGGTAPSS